MTSTISVKSSKGNLVEVKPPRCAVRAIEYDWGQITFRMNDVDEITNADVVYMCESAKLAIMHGKAEKQLSDDVTDE